MGLTSVIKQIREQRRLNTEIRASLSPVEQKALELINWYGGYRKKPNDRWTSQGGWKMPPSTPRPPFPRPNAPKSDKEPVYATEYVLMKDFLTAHPDYRTWNAQAIRRYYSL